MQHLVIFCHTFGPSRLAPRVDLEVLEVLSMGEVFEKWSQGHGRGD